MSFKAKERLALVRVKVEWAKKHLRNLATEILGLEHTHVVVTQEDGDISNKFTWGHFPKLPWLSTSAFFASCRPSVDLATLMS
jgi:hypothetical protein